MFSSGSVCRYKLSSISTAVALFDEALQLAERSGFPCGLLLSDILQWQSRCRRLRDYVAARDDVRARWSSRNTGRPRRDRARFRGLSFCPAREATGLSRGYAQRARGSTKPSTTSATSGACT